MASEDKILRVGQGKEKVTQEQLDKFLQDNNLNSLSDLPKCKICGKRRVRFLVKENKIFDTCGRYDSCSYNALKERHKDLIKVGLNYYTKEQVQEFCDEFGIDSLEDRPECSCGVKVYVNIPNKIMGSTCGKNGCLHEIRSNAARKATRTKMDNGTYKSPTELMSPEQRREASRKAVETIKKRYTSEELSARGRHAASFITPEKRREISHKANITRWKKGNHNFQMTPEAKSARARKGAYTKIRMGKISNIVSKVECECFEFLKENLDSEMTQQYLIGRGLEHAFDMYSPKYHCLIEFDGDFWHRNKQEVDARYNEIAIKNGYRIFRIKEGDYYKDKNQVLNSLKEYLNG